MNRSSKLYVGSPIDLDDLIPPHDSEIHISRHGCVVCSAQTLIDISRGALEPERIEEYVNKVLQGDKE